MVGHLNQRLYGTRDAAPNFQKQVQTFMQTIDFRKGRYNLCTHFHIELKLRTLVHGDGFAASELAK